MYHLITLLKKKRTFTNTQKLKITRSTKSGWFSFGGYWNINLHDSIGHNNSSQIYKVSLITFSSFNNTHNYGYILTDTPVGNIQFIIILLIQQRVILEAHIHMMMILIY